MAELSNRIVADNRDAFGKGASRRLRAAGRIPAVIYGHGTDPRHVSLPGHEVTLLVRKANQVLELVVGGEEQLALVKDVQRDPVKQVIEHIDLLVVVKGEKVQVDVPIVVEGDAAPGATVIQDAAHLTLEVEATHIPAHVVVSVEGLEIGTHITAADVALPKGATLVTEPETIVVGVAATAAETAAENEAESDAAAE